MSKSVNFFDETHFKIFFSDELPKTLQFNEFCKINFLLEKDGYLSFGYSKTKKASIIGSFFTIMRYGSNV
jgi:hypothetical protein